jgi:hypothetical protein
MSSRNTDVPALLPVLARGKHRKPRHGACFMELASYLAGERWSDHPRCTHHLLAALARDVNDYTSDGARPRLARWIPSVIGLTTDDPRIDVEIALGCATTALPVVAAERQRVMAVAILSCERVSADLTHRPVGSLTDRSRTALAWMPDAARWAERFRGNTPTSVRSFQTQAAPIIVHSAAQGIAQACIPQPDALLRELLVGAIGVFPKAGPTDGHAGFDTPEWARACQLTGVAVT